MQIHEKVGQFYLGRLLDPAGTPGDPLLYDAKDLTTHGLCVGMTGSGKTGLCLSLIEEAALDNIPVLAVDPKGDLGNLLLAFPELRPEDFQPWVDPAEAARKGLDPATFAAQTAETWRKGLAASGMDAERIRRLRESADFAVYTPGSNAGLPVSLLRSFSPPPAEVMNDAEALRERLTSTVSSLLALVGVQADPLRSREHVLLGNLLAQAWQRQDAPDLSALIHGILKPPFPRIGVLDLEVFFPAADRQALAMAFNNLLASPGFASWLEGEPLDIQRMLFTPEGKARVSIVSIAHLSDGERMFFVTQLLNEVVAWMRRQAGTSSLRALLYMDEIFGFFPPSAEPPSKRPMLLLLKQARAFGLGVLLATQNPVDLDYKGLGNTGTWFIGRLQTERDKLRVLDGLEGAAATAGQPFVRSTMDTLLSGLGNRVFLLNNVHDDGPVLFQTRWCLSYLRGPLTRPQIAELMAARKTGRPAAAPPPLPGVPAGPQAHRPLAPQGVREVFLPPDLPLPGAPRVYAPWVRAVVSLHYVQPSAGIDAWRNLTLLAPFSDDGAQPAWDPRLALDTSGFHPLAAPEEPATWHPLPSAAGRPASFAAWSRQLEAWLYQYLPLVVHRDPVLNLTSRPGETPGDFLARRNHAAREARDVEVEKLRRAYAPKLATLQDRLRRAETRVEKEQSQYQQQRMNSMVSIGTALLGAFLGRGRGLSSTGLGRAGTAISRVGRAASERADVARAEEDIGVVTAKIQELESSLQADIDAVTTRLRVDDAALEILRILPRKGDIAVEELGLAWKAG